MSDVALNELLEEVSASFAALDADAPVIRLSDCPRCGCSVSLKQDQRERVWEIGCCGHAEVHRSRAKALARISHEPLSMMRRPASGR